MDLLAQASRTVDEIATASRMSIANTSQHLQALYSAGLVVRQREGTRIRYSLAGDDVTRLWISLRDVAAERVAEVGRAASAYVGAEVESIGPRELRERLQAGDVILLDVRPREEFAAGHIDGARSIPIDELDRRLSELPSHTEVVAYCRGPFCAYAHRAVRTLQASGRSARRFGGGWPEWRLAQIEHRPAAERA